MQIPLHLKTTLLASVAIVFVMTVTLAFFTMRVVNRLQNEQKNFAEAQAESLAEKIADTFPFNDKQQVERLVEIFVKARIGETTEHEIRVWKSDDTDFIKRIGANNSTIKMPPEAKIAIGIRQEAKIIEMDSNQIIYRVFVPIIYENRIEGAVEVSERLESFSTLASRYLLTEFWLGLIFIALSALIIYLLTRHFVYRRLNIITSAMNRAKAGELQARAEVSGEDELGLLGKELNRMLDEIEDFTKGQEKHNEVLAEKVKAATSEVKMRNKELERANTEIWQATSRLSKLEKLAVAGQTAAQFAHEVGTPLNLISGHVQLLRLRFKTDEDESAQKRLDVIGSQIERIEGIVRSMLDKTRFGEVVFESLDINYVLASVLEIVGPKLEAENIKLTKDLSVGLPKIEGNTEHLQQVFLNLLNNATDAMPEGGRLLLKTEKTESGIVSIEITDNGLGMDEETKKRLFEPLFTTKQRGHGTGLGMVVVRQILNEHNAQIRVISAINKGTTFIIQIPLVDDIKKEIL